MFYGRKIIYTAGTFDLFHIGHLRLLQRCLTYGHYLIVGISTDELVINYKSHKPVIPYDQRKEIIDSLQFVTCTIKQRKLLDISQLMKLDFDIFIIGDDWRDSKEAGIEWLKKEKEVIFLPRTKGVDSTTIKDSI